MNWQLPALGAAWSMLLMLALAAKWKLLGWPALAGAVAATLVAALPFLWVYPLCETRWCPAAGLAAQAALALALALAMLLCRFWRDPERAPPEEDGVVLSAADGKVLYIRTVDEGSTPLVTKAGRDYLLEELTGSDLLDGPAYVIGVEMNLLDVHVTRCPMAGNVTQQKRIPGKFISLGRDEAPFVNERMTTTIENPSLVLGVVQVASRLVRSVVSYVTEGEPVSAGQRLGMIRFGSLVAVIVPRREDVELEVKPGDLVTAGISILARYDVPPR